MCVGLRAAFSEEFLDHFLSGPLRRLNVRLAGVYFRRVRVCRTVLAPDPVELRASRVDLCDCRLVERACDHRVDLCFKIDDGSPSAPPPFDPVELSDTMPARGLVRMRVETLGRRIEYCHCCPCCCQALRVERRLGPGYILPSEAVPETGDGCLRCGRCESACPLGVRVAGAPDLERCIGCGLCVHACPEKAIRMRPRRRSAAWRSPASRERSLSRNRALAHLIGAFMTLYVLVLRWRFVRSHPGG